MLMSLIFNSNEANSALHLCGLFTESIEVSFFEKHLAVGEVLVQGKGERTQRGPGLARSWGQEGDCD